MVVPDVDEICERYKGVIKSSSDLFIVTSDFYFLQHDYVLMKNNKVRKSFVKFYILFFL
jgi:hypothetical protein